MQGGEVHLVVARLGGGQLQLNAVLFLALQGRLHLTSLLKKPEQGAAAHRRSAVRRLVGCRPPEGPRTGARRARVDHRRAARLFCQFSFLYDKFPE